MKRSSSAPNVAKLLQTVDLKPMTVQTNLGLMDRSGLSTSNVSLPGDFTRQPELSPKRQPLSSPLPLSRINSPTTKYRVTQIKMEESLDERDNEREVQEQMQLTKTLDGSMKLGHHVENPIEAIEMWSLPTHPPSAFVPPSSPLTSKMRSRSLTPTSPSSTRTFSSYRRSCSPVLRPSSLCFQIGKRKRDDSEDMDTSPTIPSKKLQLGHASPYSGLSPCVSPLMGNSPLHYSFSRKSSTTQSESTPLSSPSSININPFALKYDSGNPIDQWQSLSSSCGSTCSSTAHSPTVGTPMHQGLSRNTPVYLDDIPSTKLGSQRLSNGSLEDQKMDAVDLVMEAPTPLSPKGLQFRQKPFPLSVATLPSPIPRPISNNGPMDSFNHIIGSSPLSQQSAWSSPSTSPIMRSQSNSPAVIVESDRSSVETTPNHKHPQHTLHHDKHLSPFNSEIHSYTPRVIKPAKTRLQKSVLSVTSSKPMIRPEPQKPLPTNSLDSYNPGRSFPPLSGRLSTSSPLTKLTMSSNLDSEQLQGQLSPAKARRVRNSKRRMSNGSIDSQDDSFMESDDGSVIESFEESIPSKVVRTIS